MPTQATGPGEPRRKFRSIQRWPVRADTEARRPLNFTDNILDYMDALGMPTVPVYGYGRKDYGNVTGTGSPYPYRMHGIGQA